MEDERVWHETQLDFEFVNENFPHYKPEEEAGTFFFGDAVPRIGDRVGLSEICFEVSFVVWSRCNNGFLAARVHLRPLTGPNYGPIPEPSEGR